MRLTEQQRQELRDVILDCACLLESEKDDIISAIVSWVEAQDDRSYSEKIKQDVEEVNLDDPHFKGERYEKEIDQKALARGFFKVFCFMAEHEGWHTDTEIADQTGVYIPSVQRYRSYCRSPEWGSHVVEARRRHGCRTFEYRLIPNKESLTYKRFMELQLIPA